MRSRARGWSRCVRFIPLGTLALLAVAGCGSSTDDAEPGGSSARGLVTLRVELPAPIRGRQAPEIDRVAATVNGPGMRSLSQDLAYSASSQAYEGTLTVPAGRDRVFRVDAWDVDGFLAYEGESDPVSIPANAVVPINITLARATGSAVVTASLENGGGGGGNGGASFWIYRDFGHPDNHFIPSGFMGDHSDVSLDEHYDIDPHSGATAIQVTYAAAGSQGFGWAGVYWQEPENNWGDVADAGFDLEALGMVRLTFWAKGRHGGERVEFGVGGITGDYPDSLQPARKARFTLTTGWVRYEIDLASADLSHVIGGFLWAMPQAQGPAEFYLDDIRFQE